MFETLSQPSTLLETVNFFRADVERKLDADSRAEKGQFLTSPSVARLMTSMLANRPTDLNILDAGAGIGSLSAACVVQACGWDPKPKSIAITAYEMESVLIEYLRTTLEECRAVCQQADVDYKYEILQGDFIGACVEMLKEGPLFSVGHKGFNCSILNPPYRKISSNSRARRLLHNIGIETSNLYTAFLWLVMKLLEPGGEIVAITPRSFCNGPYFRPFRYALLELMTIKRIHLFESRQKAFAEDDVLQENIIMHAVKSLNREAQVIISSSSGPDEDDVTLRTIRGEQLVHPDDPDAFVHIVPDELGHQIGEQMRSFDTSLEDLGISVSTGRVVDFRVKHLLRKQTEGGVIPLIYPGNLTRGRVVWPVTNGKKPISLAAKAANEELLLPTDFYVLVKRFSAKEERRRIVAAVYDPGNVPGEKVGFENHLNYYHRMGRGLSQDLARGLAAFLNSTLVDQYFRQFSGHTQVNANDLRSMKYPSEIKLLALGARIGDNYLDQDKLDLVVTEEVGLMAENLNTPNPVKAKKKIVDALNVLKALNIPREQQNDRSALTLLALLDLRAETSWTEASAALLGITEMMDYFKKYYGVTYAPNTRETVRRQTIHQFVQIGLALENPDDPERPINSPKTHYQIEPSALKLLKTFSSDEWEENLRQYLKTAETLKRLQAKEREMTLIPVKLPDGEQITLSGGGQNVLIKKIVEDFCPRFTPGGNLVYLGDAGEKLKLNGLAYLRKLGVEIDKHGKIPDVIIHLTQKNWLVLIEAVTSHGPIDIKRHNELKELFRRSSTGLVFVTAFETRRAMVKYLHQIAWETEVWVAEAPSHIIHFNGERFLGPYE